MEPSLKAVGLYSKPAEQLLLGTACVESNLGTYLHQIKGPALGVFQIEPATHMDIWKNYLKYRDSLRKVILGMLPKQDEQATPDSGLLITDLRYSAVMARLVYRRSPIALQQENDWESAARVWKKVYNTDLGKGTVAKFARSLEICSVDCQEVRK